MGVTLADEQVQTVLDKLDAIRLELLKLRAMLVPARATTQRERREIATAHREYARGQSVRLEDVLKELGYLDLALERKVTR